MKEEDEYYEEDSITKENRIRMVADFETNDIGDEGNKSTYLRPSRNNKSANEINKSQIIDGKKNDYHRDNDKENIAVDSKQKGSNEKKNMRKKQSRNKDKQPHKNNGLKLNTCRGVGVNL